MSLKWLETYSSPSTVRAYKWGLEQFFKALGFKDSLEENARAYLSQKRNYEEDLKAYFVNLKGKPPKSVDICLTAVKMFLMENGVELPAIFWRRLKGRRKGSRALMLDKVPSNAELRRILSHMDVKGKSLFLVLASSGMRIGEALKLQVDDVDLTSEPARINIRGEYTKTGNPRVAFISFEAKEALEEWLKIMEDELKVAVKRSRYGKRLKTAVYGPSNLTQPTLFGETPSPKAALTNASSTIMAWEGLRFTRTCLESFSGQGWQLLSPLTLLRL